MALLMISCSDAHDGSIDFSMMISAGDFSVHASTIGTFIIGVSTIGAILSGVAV
ncbi:MAG: hypothetical protein WCP92_01405 [bacterium]